MPSSRKPSPLPDSLRQSLSAAREALLALHKSLLDRERLIYERSHLPITSSGEFLQLVIHDPAFAWLHPLSGLVVQLDEAEESREPSASAEVEALLERARTEIWPEAAGTPLQQNYHQALRDTPAVAAAHDRWKAAR